MPKSRPRGARKATKLLQNRPRDSQDPPKIHLKSLKNASQPLLGLYWALLGRSWQLLGCSWAALGHSWGAPGLVFGASWCSWAMSWSPWALLNRSGDAPGPFPTALGALLGTKTSALSCLGESHVLPDLLESARKSGWRCAGTSAFIRSACAFFPPARGGCAKHSELNVTLVGDPVSTAFQLLVPPRPSKKLSIKY